MHKQADERGDDLHIMHALPGALMAAFAAQAADVGGAGCSTASMRALNPPDGAVVLAGIAQLIHFC
jgi:hypothetical protein